MINIRLIKLIKRDIKVKNSCLGGNFNFVTLAHRADRIESTPTTPLIFPFFIKQQPRALVYHLHVFLEQVGRLVLVSHRID